MMFILCAVVAIACFFAWRGAAKKVQEHNITFRGLSGIALIGTVIFAALALLQCFTIVPAGNVAWWISSGPSPKRL
jgi:hypothetical protein